MLCLMTFAFGAGFGNGSVGTVNTTDGNRFRIFTNKAELINYVTTHKGDFLNLSTDQVAKYDDNFFAKNALVMFVTDGMSGSIKVVYEGYKLIAGELHVTVKEMSPSIHTMDLHYNTLVAEIPQDIAGSITSVVIDSYRVQI